MILSNVYWQDNGGYLAQNIFANLLAASRGSNLGLVGCTRIELAIWCGLI